MPGSVTFALIFKKNCFLTFLEGEFRGTDWNNILACLPCQDKTFCRFSVTELPKFSMGFNP